MRIFVVGPWRCGSTTFAKAAAHATNYTVGHESQSGGPETWDFPDNHIEVACHLGIFLPFLIHRYGDEYGDESVRVVLLARGDEAAHERSLIAMDDGRTVMEFCRIFLRVREISKTDAAMLMARALQHITFSASSWASNAFYFLLERAHLDWPACWQFMGCEGDFDGSLAEWDWLQAQGAANGPED
jgi:hypothetical protein